MNKKSRKELQWCIQNLEICNGWLIVQDHSFVLIKTDASKKGWGKFCQGIPTRGEWISQEMEMHINILELKAVKLALMSFQKQMEVKAVHSQIDNTTALMYLLKMGFTGNKTLLDLAKDIWDYILKNGITITAKFLPSCLNVGKDWQSRSP